MTTGHLTWQECTEARNQAQRIQRTINEATEPRLTRCSAPIRFRPDPTSADQASPYGLEIRIKPLEMITDFRDEPARRIAARLREWAELLNQAAASLDG